MADFHPTIYQVHLELIASHLWDASAAYRENKLSQFMEKARAGGKRQVDVYGRYSFLGSFKVEK
jgi:hypothetical protein